MSRAPGSTTWIPGRGDYGAHYSTDLIEVIERKNCAKGCLKSGYAPGARRVRSRRRLPHPRDRLGR